MIDHRAFESALADFAQLLVTDFEVPDVLQGLCDHALQVLRLSGAGVSLLHSGHLRAAWATGEAWQDLEVLQLQLGQGPCQDVLDQGLPLTARLPQDLARWPLYVPAAVERGVRTLAALPLRARSQTWGVLDLYSTRAEAFDAEHLHAARVLTDIAASFLVTAADRDAREAAEDELRLQALHDPLTGLPNRLLLLDHLRHAISLASRRPGTAGLLFLDLDRFKQVNDAYGHEAGDRLLGQVAERLRATLRPSDTLTRHGGDEFVVLCEGVDDAAEGLPDICRRLAAAIAEPFRLVEGDVTVGVSIGAVLIAPGDTPEQVLRDADAAMYRAKRSGSGLLLSDRRSDSGAADRLRLETELRVAVERGEMRVHYQPIVSLRYGGHQGYEALLRWQHPERGLLRAGDFLPAVEQTGLIGTIGLWVLRQACRHIATSSAAGADGGWFVSVNVAARQLAHPDFLGWVREAFAETGVDPGQLMLEVTETALLGDGDASLSVLRELGELGVRVAIDDFGTGYSSLAYLKHLPASVLKIDKLFVQGLGRDARDEALVRGIVTLGHELGLTVVAEGIETGAQHDVLVQAGCDSGQGYLYGRPVAHPVGRDPGATGRGPGSDLSSAV